MHEMLIHPEVEIQDHLLKKPFSSVLIVIAKHPNVVSVNKEEENEDVQRSLGSCTETEMHLF